MKFLTIKRTAYLGIAALLSAAALSGCSDDNESPDNGSSGTAGSAGSGGSASQPSGDAVTEAVLAACPQSSSLIETTEWMSCLEGKRLSGKEPFNGKPCELRIGENGAFEYRRDGAVAITIPARDQWEDANGTYQNFASPGRLFLASIAPDTMAVEGEPRVTRLSVSLFPLASMDDKVEVAYLDAQLASQTYNCTLDER